MSSFKNKTVWIVGASSGIGEALALECAGKGARLMLSSRGKEALERVALACQNLGTEAKILPLDLTKPDTHGALTQLAQEQMGQIDHLILCGGVSQRSTVLNTKMETYRRILEIDLFGYISLTKWVLPGMVQRKSGHITAIGSVAGKIGTPMRSGYAAAKHALFGFFESLYFEHYQDGIRVSVIAPGYVKTDIGLNALKGDGSLYQKTDGGVANGMEVSECARKIVRAIEKEKLTAVIAQFRERMAVTIKRFFPGIFIRAFRKVDPVN